MSLPDDVGAAADSAARLHHLKEQYLHEISRYDAVPKDENSVAAAVQEEQERYDDMDTTTLRDQILYDRAFMRESVETLADELQEAVQEAYAAAADMVSNDRIDSATERARYNTGVESYSPREAAEQIVDDLHDLAAVDAETLPQIGVHTGAHALIDGPSIPPVGTPEAEAAAANRTYLDMTTAEQDAAFERQLEQSAETDASDGFEPGWTVRP